MLVCLASALAETPDPPFLFSPCHVSKCPAQFKAKLWRIGFTAHSLFFKVALLPLRLVIPNNFTFYMQGARGLEKGSLVCPDARPCKAA